MAARSKEESVFFCNQCGYESRKWMGQCPSCKTWGSFSEEPVRKVVPASGAGASGTGRKSFGAGSGLIGSGAPKPVPISEISAQEEDRIPTGFDEFSRVWAAGSCPEA